MIGRRAATFLMVLGVPYKDVLSLKKKKKCFPLGTFLKILSSSGLCDAVCIRVSTSCLPLHPQPALLPHL